MQPLLASRGLAAATRRCRLRPLAPAGTAQLSSTAAAATSSSFSSSPSSAAAVTAAAPPPLPPGRRLTLDEVVSFCKRRGFIFPGSELYGSIGTGYDYGPLGAMLKKNVQDAWWRDFIERRADCVPIESALLMNPRVWRASGHVQQFVDPLTECASCRRRVRADKLVKAAVEALVAGGRADAVPPPLRDPATLGSLSLAQLGDAMGALGCSCPSCGARGDKGLGRPRTFNLLFKTHVGPVMPEDDGALLGGDEAQQRQQQQYAGGAAAGGAAAAQPPHANPNATSISYLRPETAQGVYVNFGNVLSSLRRKLPLGIGQVGKSFRNEIAVGNFVFRTREFDQMELQYFCDPADSERHYRYWVDTCEAWLHGLGLSPAHVRRREYAGKELAHYALATTDLEYRYPFGWEELWGVANRGDFDLRAHSAASGTELVYRDVTVNGSKVRAVGTGRWGTARLRRLICVCSCFIWLTALSPQRPHHTRAPFHSGVLPARRGAGGGRQPAAAGVPVRGARAGGPAARRERRRQHQRGCRCARRRRRARRGRRPSGAAPARAPGAVQGGGAAGGQEQGAPGGHGGGPARPHAGAPARGVRRHAVHRQALPPAGRDRHAAVRDARHALRRGRHRDGALPRQHGAGAPARRRGRGAVRAQRLLAVGAGVRVCCRGRRDWRWRRRE
jgi:hypothetical protein